MALNAGWGSGKLACAGQGNAHGLSVRTCRCTRASHRACNPVAGAPSVCGAWSAWIGGMLWPLALCGGHLTWATEAAHPPSACGYEPGVVAQAGTQLIYPSKPPAHHCHHGQGTNASLDERNASRSPLPPPHTHKPPPTAAMMDAYRSPPRASRFTGPSSCPAACSHRGGHAMGTEWRGSIADTDAHPGAGRRVRA